MNKTPMKVTWQSMVLTTCLLLLSGSCAYYMYARSRQSGQIEAQDLPVSEFEKLDLSIPAGALDSISLADCAQLAAKLEERFPSHQFYISHKDNIIMPPGDNSKYLTILIKHPPYDFDAYNTGLQGERYTRIYVDGKPYNYKPTILYHNNEAREQIEIARCVQSFLDKIEKTTAQAQ